MLRDLDEVDLLFQFLLKSERESVKPHILKVLLIQLTIHVLYLM